ncbi:MAG TPA: hypothetical protein VJ865_16590 [Gemmatimonadaceae bacterium]|nr:hypothetical protein [Gemmatimonadaceae bacterium]
MKKKIAIALGTASLFFAFPLLAQSSQGLEHGRGHGRGHNNSNHSGHDDDGNSAGHRQDAPHGFGNRNIVLATPASIASVAAAVTAANAALKTGALTTPSGGIIPAPAQAATYGALTNNASSLAAIESALSTAGPSANAFVPGLVKGFARLTATPASLPSVLDDYNGFTKAASNEFIANPPPEYLAVHSVLARLVAAASTRK